MNAPVRLIALDRAVIEEMAQAKLDEAHALIALLDRVDGDPDREDDDPAEEDDHSGCEHDGREPDSDEI